MQTSVHRRQIVPNINSNVAPGANMAVVWGQGASSAHMQDTYFNAAIYAATAVGKSSDYLDDGATSVIKDFLLYDNQSGTLLQESRAVNVWQTAVHKMRPTDWRNTIGVNMLGLEGEARSATTGVSVQPTKNREDLFSAPKKAIYSIPMSDYFPLSGAYDFAQKTQLRADILLENQATAVSNIGAAAANANNFYVLASPNPLMVFEQLPVNGPQSVQYYGYKHFPRTISNGSTAHSFTLSPGKLRSLQGILMIVRNSANTTSAAANSLREFQVANLKTIQYTINGLLYPQTPMVIGGGTTGLHTGGEVYSKLEHFAKLLNRGSKYKIDYPGVSDRSGYVNSTVDDDAMTWYPLSNGNADHSSGIEMNGTDINVNLTGLDPTADHKADFFVVYDKTLKWEGAEHIAVVEDLVKN